MYKPKNKPEPTNNHLSEPQRMKCTIGNDYTWLLATYFNFAMGLLTA